MTETLARRRNPAHHWLLRAMLVPLALVFVQPSCFTSQVWSDDRSAEALLEVGPPELRVYRVPDESGGFVIELPASASALLRDLDAGDAANGNWLRVEPLQYQETAATLLALASMRWDGLDAERERTRRSWPVTIDFVLDEGPDGRRSWSLRSRQSMFHPFYDSVTYLPGFQKRTNLYTWYVLDVPCAVTPLSGTPPALGEPVLALTLSHRRLRDDGTPVVARIAWTPLALVGDLLLLPFELVWWLTP